MQQKESKRRQRWQKACVGHRVVSTLTPEAEKGQRKAYLTRASFRRAFCSSSCLSW